MLKTPHISSLLWPETPQHMHPIDQHINSAEGHELPLKENAFFPMIILDVAEAQRNRHGLYPIVK